MLTIKEQNENKSFQATIDITIFKKVRWINRQATTLWLLQHNLLIMAIIFWYRQLKIKTESFRQKKIKNFSKGSTFFAWWVEIQNMRAKWIVWPHSSDWGAGGSQRLLVLVYAKRRLWLYVRKNYLNYFNITYRREWSLDISFKEELYYENSTQHFSFKLPSSIGNQHQRQR